MEWHTRCLFSYRIGHLLGKFKTRKWLIDMGPILELVRQGRKDGQPVFTSHEILNMIFLGSQDTPHKIVRITHNVARNRLKDILKRCERWRCHGYRRFRKPHSIRCHGNADHLDSRPCSRKILHHFNSYLNCRDKTTAVIQGRPPRVRLSIPYNGSDNGQFRK